MTKIDHNDLYCMYKMERDDRTEFIIFEFQTPDSDYSFVE